MFYYSKSCLEQSLFCALPLEDPPHCFVDKLSSIISTVLSAARLLELHPSCWRKKGSHCLHLHWKHLHLHLMMSPPFALAYIYKNIYVYKDNNVWSTPKNTECTEIVCTQFLCLWVPKAMSNCVYTKIDMGLLVLPSWNQSNTYWIGAHAVTEKSLIFNKDIPSRFYWDIPTICHA